LALRFLALITSLVSVCVHEWLSKIGMCLAKVTTNDIFPEMSKTAIVQLVSDAAGIAGNSVRHQPKPEARRLKTSAHAQPNDSTAWDNSERCDTARLSINSIASR